MKGFRSNNLNFVGKVLRSTVGHLDRNPLFPLDRILPTVVHSTRYFIGVFAVSWSSLRAAIFHF